MSERKVLNKYYPPDFDPSKIPRARCPRNRQFTVRLMVPCNIKCYTCGEYIAKGKKFNARKEDVENMTYLGVRIYRFYIKCPGCLAEISFRTDPESTDYVIEAGAHRNFQALKLAEEQAAREEREAKEEIESNPMLLLENRTQQSQYEMEVLESLEDLRDMNERHAGIDLGKMTEKYEAERKLTQEQLEEAEHLEALKALGYEMIEGHMVKRIAPEQLLDELSPSKKLKSEATEPPKNVQKIPPTNKLAHKSRNNTMKSKMTGLIRAKGEYKTLQCAGSSDKGDQDSNGSGNESKINQESCSNVDRIGLDLTKESGNIVSNITDLPKSSLTTKSIGAVAQSKSCESSGSKKTFFGLGLLGVYSDSESGEDSN